MTETALEAIDPYAIKRDKTIDRDKARIEIAERQYLLFEQLTNGKEAEELRQLALDVVEDCLAGIEHKTYGPGADYQTIFENADSVKYSRRSCKKTIFIQFTNEGCVTVVGAGEDVPTMGVYANGKSKSLIVDIVNVLNRKNNRKHELDQEQDHKDDMFLDNDNLIVIKFPGIEAVGLKKPDRSRIGYIYECMNGIENYIGYCLSMTGIPILNYCQHWNYSVKYWNIWKDKEYDEIRTFLKEGKQCSK